MSVHAPESGQNASETEQANAARERATIPRRLWLTLKMVGICVVTPLAVYRLLYRYHVPLFELLPAVFATFILLLMLDRSFSWRATLKRGIRLRDLTSIASIFALAAPAIALFAYHDRPDAFLRFPLHAQGLWIMVMIIYPLISVTTQAIIMLNAVLFSFSHIIFQSLTTLVISFLGGLLFA